MAEISQETPRKVPLWPKVVLWLLVITFGIFYLDAVNERGTKERALRQAEGSASEPALAAPAPAEPTTPPDAPNKASEPGVETRVAPTGDAGTGEAGATESLPGVAPDRSTPSAPPAPPPAVDAARLDPAAPAEPESSLDQVTPAAAALPVQDLVAERRARVLAEYKAMLESVEAERRALWEPMNQMPGATDHWPTPYPPPLPFAPPGYGWTPR